MKTTVLLSSTDALGEQIVVLAARLHAGTYELLVLLREFDDRITWNNGFASIVASHFVPSEGDRRGTNAGRSLLEGAPALDRARPGRLAAESRARENAPAFSPTPSGNVSSTIGSSGHRVGDVESL